jgi:FtsH-binding integral membrane protein
MFKNDVFDRISTGEKEITARVYNFIIGATLFWGFAVNWVMIQAIPYEAIASINIWVFIIGYMASAFLGVYLYTSSDNPIISFIGYNFVVVPLGLVVTMAVGASSADVVLRAVQLTAVITCIMMFLGTAFPSFFRAIGPALFWALIVTIVVELIAVLAFGYSGSIIDYIVVLIFCGYIGYDWGRANSIPKTVDNAIDSAAALYMDIVMLFLRLLSILNNRS